VRADRMLGKLTCEDKPTPSIGAQSYL